MGKKQKRFTALRAELVRIDCGQEELAVEIGRSLEYVNIRMNGHKPWDMGDVYRIMKFLHISSERMAEYFPNEGIA